MARSVTVAADDVRAILRLIGEVRELGEDRVAWRAHLMRGLIEMLDAPVGYSGEFSTAATGIDADPQVEVGWDRPEDGEPIRELWRTGKIISDDPFIRRAFAVAFTKPGVYLRQDLTPDEEYYAVEHNQQVMRPLGVEGGLHSYLPLEPGRSIDVLTVAARWRRPLDDRARTIVKLVHEQIVPEIGRSLAARDEPSPAELSPRRRQVLELLLQGNGDKQIAAALHLSPHTINEHVTAVHRHFGVSSRTELIALFLSRHRRAQSGGEAT